MSEELIGKEKNKLKIIYLLDIMRKTDERHPINSTEIIQELGKYGISAERKAIGRDIHALQDAGYEIIMAENRNDGWYMINQAFEDYQLKMLVDAVASAQFLTIKDTRELVKKIKGMATKEGERIIDSSLVIEDSLKLRDNGFAIKFDTVMRAISDQKQIRFQYLEEAPGNKRCARKNGKIYQATPYYLGVWSHEYFVVANTNGYDNTSHYRIEMMTNLEMTDQKVRPMSEVQGFKEIGRHGRTFGNYIKESVNLWSGKTVSIKLSGINHLKREVIKKFGRDIMFRDEPDERFSVNIDVAEGEGFYQWLAQFGKNIKIESPDKCIDEYKEFVKAALDQY